MVGLCQFRKMIKGENMKKPYIVIRSRFLGALEEQINEKIKEGYQLKDWLMIEQYEGNTYYLQVMIHVAAMAAS